MSGRPMILFVCTGNTCRSYMAETIAKHYLSSRHAEAEIEIQSAGTAGFAAEPASSQASTVMAEMGYPASSHQARRLTKDMVNRASLILTMTENQRAEIIKLIPQAKDKVFLLKEYAQAEAGNLYSNNMDIMDPFGHSVEYYRICAGEIAPLVSRALDKFLRL